MPCIFLSEQDRVPASMAYLFYSSLILKAFRPFIDKL